MPDESEKQPNPNAGKRVVFASQEEGSGYDAIGVYEGNEKEAKRAALRANPELNERVQRGGVSLAAPPAAGWNPKEVSPPDPEAYKGL